jgi:hypothetical protein
VTAPGYRHAPSPPPPCPRCGRLMGDNDRVMHGVCASCCRRQRVRRTDPTGPEHWLDIAMREVLPNLDNATDPDVIGAYGIEGPGTCTCHLIPGEHPENECGALTWKATR